MSGASDVIAAATETDRARARAERARTLSVTVPDGNDCVREAHGPSPRVRVIPIPTLAPATYTVRRVPDITITAREREAPAGEVDRHHDDDLDDDGDGTSPTRDHPGGPGRPDPDHHLLPLPVSLFR